MPYYFVSFEAPDPGAPDFDQLWEMWRWMKGDLLGARFEEKEEALKKSKDEQKDAKESRYLDWSLIRFRQTDDHGQLRYFHELGLEALALTESALKTRRLDQQFIYNWGMLSACHGYVMCAVLATGNDLASLRAGLASRKSNNLDAHRRWFAHYYLRERPSCANREETEERIERLVHAITDGIVLEIPPEDQTWFEKFLSLNRNVAQKGGVQEVNPRYGRLTKAFKHKKLTEIEMKKLVKLPTDGLPPIDLDIPPPKGGTQT